MSERQTSIEKVKKLTKEHSNEFIGLNLNTINERILKACERSGRSIKDIQLVGVSKTIEPDLVNESIRLGITMIGESKPQEIKRKYDLIEGDVAWHMIGSLQTNKVKMIIDKVDLIHTLDRERLADELERRAGEAGKVIHALIQINIGDEGQKSGVAVEEVESLIRHISTCEHIQIDGLMAIAPYFESPEAVRPFFKKMKSIFEDVKKFEYNNINMSILSMGMTHDFEVAIEEGATMVRVGTGIYGKRNY